MDIRKVKKLIELLEQSNINELEINEGDESVRISRGATAVTYAAPPIVAPVAAAPAPDPIPVGNVTIRIYCDLVLIASTI